jgi:hypothetical protein
MKIKHFLITVFLFTSLGISASMAGFVEDMIDFYSKSSMEIKVPSKEQCYVLVGTEEESSTDTEKPKEEEEEEEPDCD